ncbi:unnamed protein product [Ectocarpus sp. CCAP 1310/34]|nr:unnamed protein product [Ectocarpus sp. CCAP 1310/34]
MFASQSDLGKAKAEPENKKTAFKSAAFHLILPFMAYFKGICLTTIDCREHSLLKMVGYMWGEWDQERPITQTELSKEVAVFVAPMKSTTWRVTRAALRTSMLAMLKKVTHDHTEDDGSPGREITSAYIADTMTTQMERQILQPTMEVALQEMELYVSRDVINARRLTPGHKTSDKTDPDKYRTFPVVKEFLEKAFGGKHSGGDKYHVIRETYVAIVSIT